MSTEVLERERWLNNLPRTPGRPWWYRMVGSPLFWLTLVLVPFYLFCLYSQYWMLHPDTTFPDGTVALGLNNESLQFAAFWAMWSALAWSLLFIWLDRFRPQGVLVWLLTFGWGACASTWISIHLNTWAGQAMATTDANADAGSRPAIFIAPFVEEASKATVLFLLVILVRRKVVSRLSIVSLAGLSAVGFAFVENIVYYARAYVFAHNTIEVKNPLEEVMELVKLRGFYTSFAHPLFTMMTAFGIAVALKTRSKWVRVTAPLAGFLLAAGGHMLFNGTVSSRPPSSLMREYYMVLGLVALLTLMMIIHVFAQSRLIRRRLGDYRAVGWLTERDPIVFSGPFKRIKLLLAGMLRGPRTWWRTAKFMRRMTELAYLREDRVRGTLDSIGDDRAHELIQEIEALRPKALTETQGLTILPPRRPKPSTQQPPPPLAPGPAGIGGNWPAR